MPAEALAMGVNPSTAVPKKLPSITWPEPAAIRMPCRAFAEITLPWLRALPPTVTFEPEIRTIPAPPLPAPALPNAFRPIQLPCTVTLLAAT